MKELVLFDIVLSYDAAKIRLFLQRNRKYFLLLRRFRIPMLYFCNRKDKEIAIKNKDKDMFTKELTLDEIKFGEILFSDESMELFPMHGEEIILVDVYQERYIAHIHPTENSIVGVWDMHKNNEAQEGMSITIRLVDPLYNTYRVYYDD